MSARQATTEAKRRARILAALDDLRARLASGKREAWARFWPRETEADDEIGAGLWGTERVLRWFLLGQTSEWDFPVNASEWRELGAMARRMERETGEPWTEAEALSELLRRGAKRYRTDAGFRERVAAGLDPERRSTRRALRRRGNFEITLPNALLESVGRVDSPGDAHCRGSLLIEQFFRLRAELLPATARKAA